MVTQRLFQGREDEKMAFERNWNLETSLHQAGTLTRSVDWLIVGIQHLSIRAWKGPWFSVQCCSILPLSSICQRAIGVQYIHHWFTGLSHVVHLMLSHRASYCSGKIQSALREVCMIPHLWREHQIILTVVSFKFVLGLTDDASRRTCNKDHPFKTFFERMVC